MKRLLITILVIGISICSFATEIIKNIEVSSFNGIRVSSVYDVTLIKSNTNTLKITVSKELEEYLDIRVESNTLRLSINTDDLPRSIRNNMDGYTLKAEVTMPTFELLKVSGAANFNSNDSFQVVDFKGDFSGASDIKGLKIEGGRAEIEASGASDVYIVGKDISYLELDISGASDIDVIGTFKEIELEASGASDVYLKGTSEKLEISASGASDVDADELISNIVEVDASGASDVDVNPMVSLEISTSGGSSLDYRGNDGLSIDKIDVSGGSNVRKK